jgi:transcriptional regulator NrdR family protein
MKCPLCQAPSDVENTKSVDGIPIRRRVCYNDHSFNTKEVATSEPRPRRKNAKSVQPKDSFK